MKVTLENYWMGRDQKYPLALTTDIRRNAERTVALVNQLLQEAELAGVSLDRTADGNPLSSGWRPPEVNAATSGAARRSLHMTGEAADIFDPDGELDDWLMTDAGQAVLVRLGLWLEHPGSTRRWSHVQTRPPASKRRVFYP